MNSRRCMSDPKLKKRHLSGSNEYFDRGRNRHKKHFRSAQPMSQLGQKPTNRHQSKSTFVCFGWWVQPIDATPSNLAR